ncbi:MAG: hypothetical protein ACO3A2_06275 [Bdellovibrionia bacterium]
MTQIQSILSSVQQLRGSIGGVLSPQAQGSKQAFIQFWIPMRALGSEVKRFAT